jgi:NADPH-dependent F420 reductase
MRLAIIGGTGKEGRGLALRWAAAGHQVIIGSRDAERGRAGALELTGILAGKGHADANLSGGDNRWAVGECEIALLAVPYGAHANTLASLEGALAGKILIDITVPLVPPNVRRVHLPPGQAAALEAQAALGDEVRVVGALHHISSVHLAELEHTIDSDVLVCGDDKDARAQVIALVADLGLRGLDAGPLANAVALEALTPVLLHMNRHYKSRGCGLRITGIPE